MQQVETITEVSAQAEEKEVYQTASGHCTISANSTLGYLQLKMEGKVEVEEYKQVMEQLLEIAKTLPYSNLIYNLKGLTNTDPRARAWYVGTFLPKAIKALDREMRSAMIQPSSLFQRMAAETVSKATKLMNVKTESRYFDNKQAALDWLYQ